MKTQITFPFLLAQVSQAYIVQVLLAAGIADVQINSIESSNGVMTVDANRLLTSDEKAAVKTAFLNNILTVDNI